MVLALFSSMYPRSLPPPAFDRSIMACVLSPVHVLLLSFGFDGHRRVYSCPTITPKNDPVLKFHLLGLEATRVRARSKPSLVPSNSSVAAKEAESTNTWLSLFAI